MRKIRDTHVVRSMLKQWANSTSDPRSALSHAAYVSTGVDPKNGFYLSIAPELLAELRKVVPVEELKD